MKRCRKTKIDVMIAQDTSNQCVDFQIKRSKVKGQGLGLSCSVQRIAWLTDGLKYLSSFGHQSVYCVLCSVTRLCSVFHVQSPECVLCFVLFCVSCSVTRVCSVFCVVLCFVFTHQGVLCSVFRVQAVLALAASWTSKQASERTLTGTVIDSGDGVTHVIPVVRAQH